MSESQQLANALETLQSLQANGVVAIKASRDLKESERKSLLKAGYIQRVMKGWYVCTRPDVRPGDTTPWFSSFWDFCAQYFEEKYGEQWSLSAEQSIQLHVGDNSVPKQVLVRSPKAGDKNTPLLYQTSVYDLRSKIAPDEELELQDGLRIYRLPIALVEASPAFFGKDQLAAKSALGAIRNASELLPKLLSGRHSTIAGRLCGAFRTIDANEIADEIKNAMTSAGHEIRETNPFSDDQQIPISTRNPKAIRIQMMWQEMREVVLSVFPKAPDEIADAKAYLKHVDDVYKSDAYHSLSIEGYKVTPALIEKVRSGEWSPAASEEDQKERNALAARGYYVAFEKVKSGIERVTQGESAVEIAKKDHSDWFRELFAPSVQAGITNAAYLAGYRQSPVYISASRHIPPSASNVAELMSTFFELLENESDAGVRVVLGHFVFVYIHPYPDGNGRTARFLMNMMMASGGFPWTVIEVDRRDEYMAALEDASVNQNIEPFARFLGSLLNPA